MLRKRSFLTGPKCWTRLYNVLSLESSCDDCCVALLQKKPGQKAVVIDQMKRTLNSQSDGGIIPTKAHEFHQSVIGNMVTEFCGRNSLQETPPDLICCTRGPGMVGSLSVSLQLAKGLAIAWNKPFIGVHHMLGHILVSKLSSSPPKYPFLSLLASGGHTLLVLSKSAEHHEILADTCDIAVGDSLDKCAREIGIQGNVLGKELEAYVNSIPEDVKRHFDSISTETRDNEFGFKLRLPLKGPHNKVIPDDIQFTFAPFLSSIQRHKLHEPSTKETLNETLKQFLAYKTQHYLFKHIIDRVNIALLKHGTGNDKCVGDGKLVGVKDLIFSGGVACNKTFRTMLQTDLKPSLIGQDKFNFQFPDISLCTDNAVMIGAAGIDIFEDLKVKTDLDVLPLRKWPMDELLSVDGWINVGNDEVNEIVNR